MVYRAIYSAKEENDRNYEITYCIINDTDSYYIESYINGKGKVELSFLGSCSEEKAESLVHLLAENSVRPVHIDDIISDLRF